MLNAVEDMERSIETWTQFLGFGHRLPAEKDGSWETGWIVYNAESV
jgi:hypothetical protein